jgi:hypothetical protein
MWGRSSLETVVKREVPTISLATTVRRYAHRPAQISEPGGRAPGSGSVMLKAIPEGDR